MSAIEYHYWPAKVRLQSGVDVVVMEQLEPSRSIVLAFPDDTKARVVGVPVLQDDYTIRFSDDHVSIPYPPRYYTAPSNPAKFRENGELLEGRAEWHPVAPNGGSTVWVSVTANDVRRVWFGGTLDIETASKKPSHLTELRVREAANGIVAERVETRTLGVSVGCGCQGKGWQRS